jgi:hypothetical protein
MVRRKIFHRASSFHGLNHGMITLKSEYPYKCSRLAPLTGVPARYFGGDFLTTNFCSGPSLWGGAGETETFRFDKALEEELSV